MGKMNNRKWIAINNVIYCSHFFAKLDVSSQFSSSGVVVVEAVVDLVIWVVIMDGGVKIKVNNGLVILVPIRGGGLVRLVVIVLVVIIVLALFGSEEVKDDNNVWLMLIGDCDV